MEMGYYIIHGDLFMDLGNETLKCIASTKRKMLGVYNLHADLNKPWVSKFDNKEDALAVMKEDAYWDNLIVYQI